MGSGVALVGSALTSLFTISDLLILLFERLLLLLLTLLMQKSKELFGRLTISSVSWALGSFSAMFSSRCPLLVLGLRLPAVDGRFSTGFLVI